MSTDTEYLGEKFESENWNGSRSVPKDFATLLDAMRASRDQFKVVWARCADHPTGIFTYTQPEEPSFSQTERGGHRDDV